MADLTRPIPISPCHSIDADSTNSIAYAVSAAVREKVTFSNDIESTYYIESKVLGTGRFGSVREAYHKTSGMRCAVKSIRKDHPSIEPGAIAREITSLLEMKNHPSIAQLVDVFEDAEYVHIVTDLCTGGELYDSIVQHATTNSLDCNTSSHRTCCFPEDKAARLIYQLLDAVAYLHSHNIVHRDLKPENILLQTTDVDSPIKIIDFGMAREHNVDESPMTRCLGTPYYIAPEVLRKNYDRMCDLWSVGIITYILLCGYPPFNGDDNKTIHAAILKGKYRFPVREWKGTSKEAREFIRRLLQVDTRKRMTAEEALRHPWIVNAVVVREIPLAYDQKKMISHEQHLGLGGEVAAVKASGIRPRAIVSTHFRVKTWF